MGSGMPSESLPSVDDDETCKTEEQTTSTGGGGSGGGTDEQGDLWCFFLSTYDAYGRLTSRTNTGNCWRM